MSTIVHRASQCRPLPPRRFFDNRYVYCVLSQRAGGLSVGINMNPDKRCNFDCVYCEIDRTERRKASPILRVCQVIHELEKVLEMIREGRIGEMGYHVTDPAQLPFREVALSGDGEPTLCPNFREVVEAVVEFRARRSLPHFKLVLITNTTGLQSPEVRRGIEAFAATDEVWAKLDAGTQGYMDFVNCADISLDEVLANILSLAVERPVVIQTLIPMIAGEEPPAGEILALGERLRELRAAGAQIPVVQIYSAHRPAMDAICSHLPLRSLSTAARTIRNISGLRVEVF